MTIARVDRNWQVRLLTALIVGWETGDWSRFESELLSAEGHHQGRVGTARRLFPKAPDEVVGLFGGRPDDAAREILGSVSRNGEWKPGRAGLTEREARAIDLATYGMQPWEIRDLMEPQRRRKGPQLAVETVDRYLRSAQTKINALMGVDEKGAGS